MKSYFTLVMNLFHLMIFWNTLHTGEPGYQFSSFAPCYMLNKVLNRFPCGDFPEAVMKCFTKVKSAYISKAETINPTAP